MCLVCISRCLVCISRCADLPRPRTTAGPPSVLNNNHLPSSRLLSQDSSPTVTFVTVEGIPVFLLSVRFSRSASSHCQLSKQGCGEYKHLVGYSFFMMEDDLGRGISFHVFHVNVGHWCYLKAWSSHEGCFLGQLYYKFCKFYI